ncbi:MAG: hypothetical protein P3X22_005120 [Thermoprotei archaeon]|nr:hypothetical protein [Thermoprotei archaeon]
MSVMLEMTASRVAALVVLVLIMLSLSPALRAEAGLLVLTNSIVVPGGLVGFRLDYGEARGSGVLTGLGLEFYISGDGSPVIRPYDVLVARVIVAPGVETVFGTLRLPDNLTLYRLLWAPSGTLYVKVTDGFGVVVAGVPVDLSLSKLSRALQLSNTRLSAVNNSKLGVSDHTLLIVDLSPYNLGGVLGALEYNVTRISSEEATFKLLEYSGLLKAYSSEVFKVVSVNSYGFMFTASLRGLEDFALEVPEKVDRRLGIDINYEDFTLEYLGGVYRNYTDAIKVEEGRQVNSMPQDFNWEVDIKVSLAWPRDMTVDVYPSIIVDSINRNVAGRTGELNVGDKISVTLRNFPGNAGILGEIYLYAPTIQLLGSVSVDQKTDASGRASITITLPPLPYGGRLIALAFKAGNETLYRGILAVNVTTTEIYVERVMPHVWAWTFNIKGEISEAHDIAPGSYLLVIGRGFLEDSLEFEVFDAPMKNKITTLLVKKMIGILGNGSFAAIVQVPGIGHGISPGHHSTIATLRVRGLWTFYNVGWLSNIAADPGVHYLSIDLHGAAATVYINPIPVVTSVTDPRASRIKLGLNPAYPFAASWEPEDRRIVTVEAIGLDIRRTGNLSRVSLVSLDNIVPGVGAKVEALLTGSQPVALGYFRNTYMLPVVPHTPGGYIVKVENINGLYAVASSADRRYTVRINATMALIDPWDNVSKKEIILAAPQNLTAVGYGWAANLTIRYDVSPVVGAINILLGSSNLNGTFIGQVNLTDYIKEPGAYEILFKQRENRTLPVLELMSRVSVIVRIVPPLSVKIDVGQAGYGDLPIVVFVSVFFGNKLATIDKVIDVVLEVHAPGVEAAPVALKPLDSALPRAVYYAIVDLTMLFSGKVLGSSVMFIAYAVARFDPKAPQQEAHATAATHVPPVTLASQLALAASSEKAFNDILATLDYLLARVSALQESTVWGFELTRRDIANVRLMLLTVQSEFREAVKAILNVGNVSESILATLSNVNATIVGGIALVSSDIAGLKGLLEAVNASIANIIVGKSGEIRAAIVDAKGEIIGVLEANALALKAMAGNMSMLQKDIAGASALVKSLSDALAAFRLEALSMNAAVISTLEALRADLGTVRAEVSESRAVIARLREGVEKIDATLVGVSGEISTVRGAVERLNAEIPDLARKGDLNTAVSKIEGSIQGARSFLEDSISSAADSMGLTVRNWSLIIVAVLILLTLASLIATRLLARRSPA